MVKANTRALRILGVIAIVLLMVWVLVPVYWIVSTSLQPADETFSIPPKLWPSRPQWSNYRNAIATKPVLRWVRNSLCVSVGTTLVCLSLSVFAGYALSRFRFRGNSAVGFTILLSQMLPGTLFIIPLYTTFFRLRLLDSLGGLIVAYTSFSIPLCTWMMKAYFDTIPRELEEAALIDGCSPMPALFRVILPLSTPGLVATGIYSMILAWNEFTFARTFIDSPDNWPITVGLSSFTSEYTVDWNVLMATAVICSIPILVVYLAFQRQFVQGLTSGSVKG